MTNTTEARPPLTHKRCSKCSLTKPVGEFSEDPRQSSGLQPQCKQCRAEYSARRRAANPEIGRKDGAKFHARRPFYQTVKNAQYRAKKSGVPFDLTEEYLESIWTGYCPVFRQRMAQPRSGKRSDKTQPSLDRLIPHKGYVRGNVVWISNKANTIKSDATSSEIQAVADWLRETEKELERHEAD